MASLGRLAAGVAHEIGNPLSALMNYLSILRKRGGDPAVMDGAERETRRIDQIVRGLLDYARPGHAPREMKIVCGHWSTLGLFVGHGVHAIDTGAVWGGKLSALQLDTDELRVVQVQGRDEL